MTFTCRNCQQDIKWELSGFIHVLDEECQDAAPTDESRALWKMWMSSRYGAAVALARPLIPTVENPVERKVEVLVYIPGVGHSVFTNVPLSIVNEAIAHINDNA